MIDHAKTAKVGDSVIKLLKNEANEIIKSDEFVSELTENQVDVPSDIDALLVNVIPEIVAGTYLYDTY